MEFLFSTLLPQLSNVFSFILIVLLMVGTYISWKKSFKEGIFFFLLIFIHEIFMHLSKNFLFYYELPTLVHFISKFILLLSFIILVIGMIRWNNEDGSKVET
ncbi:hypothetical protein LGQ02_03535 [Bacillus shivajii]|uniref:hypothetical protein n=1 Tax=Bacillus shivajii TaxID=1983719 RepID=UPI001CFAC167|nr:hypothetical protein [Bacillus shivajii]UCZ53869.1 hypothetical protein LGQ02_03535 [Bacillus shivajii]